MAGRNGELHFNDGPEGMAPPRLGPRSDPATNMRHGSAQSDFLRSSELCGTCHELDHPTRNRVSLTGEDQGYRLPLQTTYSEWLGSDFARGATAETCQSCHMPLASPMEALRAARAPGALDRMGVRRHDLHAANAWGMDLLRAAFPGEADAAFTAARTRIESRLRSAARVEIVEAPESAAPGASVQVRVRVTNLTGHKLPTGYEDARVMWLELRVGDAVVSGAFANDELVEDAQARIYRLQLGRREGSGLVANEFVARHEAVLEDTRIPPRGSRPEARIAPVGRDYAGGPDGTLRNWDEATYTVTLPPTGASVPITARLLYRSTTRHYVETIAAENRTDDRGRELLRLWDASGRAAPLEVGRATATVRTGGEGEEGGCAARPQGVRGQSAWAGLTLVGLLAVLRRRRSAPRAKL
jgi:MYXO-CTERM domain-containing protein